jgi:hypothetical protein
MVKKTGFRVGTTGFEMNEFGFQSDKLLVSELKNTSLRVKKGWFKGERKLVSG